uniref:Uncharacterized protein n=1 Tax=Siphoviridae sp. ctkKt3 TaxID=2825642 RepID=A0A8S5UYQ9_9CAUD|nr:MAG TPA: hypothetical protein [Siphoviridae sp. ctkKt3]
MLMINIFRHRNRKTPVLFIYTKQGSVMTMT